MIPVNIAREFTRSGETKLLGEFERRRGDTMPGGSGRRRRMMTAYRQKAIRIAQYLMENGPTKARLSPMLSRRRRFDPYSIGMSMDGLIDWVRAFTGFHRAERPTSPLGTIAPRLHNFHLGGWPFLIAKEYSRRAVR